MAATYIALAAAVYGLGETFGAFPNTISRQNFQQLAALLLVIPLVSALMDWLSLGASRHFFNRSLETAKTGRALIADETANGLWDLCAGLLCLVGAACLTTMALSFMDAVAIHAAGGAPAIEARALLLAMQAEPFAADHLWVHLLVLTTLFWTALHLLLVLWSVNAHLFFAIPGLADWLEGVYQRRIDRENDGEKIGDDDKLAMIFARASLHWAGIGLPLLTLYLIGYTTLPWLGEAVTLLITYLLLPLHDWTCAFVASML